MIKAREQLLLDVSHELKTPLTRSTVALELGKGNLSAVVRYNVGEKETMVSELLETERHDSGPEPLNLMTFDMASLVQDMAQAFPDTKPGIRLGVSPESLPLIADAKRVRTVLRILLENALKYSAHQDRPVSVSCGKSPGRIFIRVDKSRDKSTGGYARGSAFAGKSCRPMAEASTSKAKRAKGPRSPPGSRTENPQGNISIQEETDPEPSTLRKRVLCPPCFLLPDL